MSKLILKPQPTLVDFQNYIKEMVIERGFEKEPISEVFMLFLEECGELAKAARKASSMKVDSKSEKFDVGSEAADVFIYLLDICNLFNVDLEKAFRDKEEINKQRNWK